MPPGPAAIAGCRRAGLAPSGPELMGHIWGGEIKKEEFFSPRVGDGHSCVVGSTGSSRGDSSLPFSESWFPPKARQLLLPIASRREKPPLPASPVGLFGQCCSLPDPARSRPALPHLDYPVTARLPLSLPKSRLCWCRMSPQPDAPREGVSTAPPSPLPFPNPPTCSAKKHRSHRSPADPTSRGANHEILLIISFIPGLTRFPSHSERGFDQVPELFPADRKARLVLLLKGAGFAPSRVPGQCGGVEQHRNTSGGAHQPSRYKAGLQKHFAAAGKAPLFLSSFA